MDFDTQTGTNALQVFHGYSVKYPSYGLTWDEFKAAYGKKFEIYAEGIGLAINSAGISSSRVDSAMKSLSQKTQGKVPKDFNPYINELTGVATKINYLDLTTSVLADTAMEVTEGVVSFGDNVRATLGALNFLFPVVIVLGVLYYARAKILKVSK